MDQRYKIIFGPNTDPLYKFEYIANARLTAYNVSGGKSFRYPEKVEDSLDLQMRCFVVQIFHKANDPVIINAGIQTTNGEILKFSFSTNANRKQKSTATPKTKSGPSHSVKVPLPAIPHDEWVNLCIDLDYSVLKYFPGGAFESLQRVEINPTCLIRFIYVSQTPLRPEISGQDLPNKMKFMGGIKSSTTLFAENAPKSASKYRMPLRSQGAKSKPPISPLKPKRPKTVVDKEKGDAVQSQRYESPQTFEDDFEKIDDDDDNQNNNNNEEEDDETDDDAFMGSPPQINKETLNVKNGLPENEEEELELVYIEALNCYYCPNNQQYYQIDD